MQHEDQTNDVILQWSCLFGENLAQRDCLLSIERWRTEDGVDDHVEPHQSKWLQNRTENLTEVHLFRHLEIPSVLGKLLSHDLVVQMQDLEKI